MYLSVLWLNGMCACNISYLVWNKHGPNLVPMTWCSSLSVTSLMPICSSWWKQLDSILFSRVYPGQSRTSLMPICSSWWKQLDSTLFSRVYPGQSR